MILLNIKTFKINNKKIAKIVKIIQIIKNFHHKNKILNKVLSKLEILTISLKMKNSFTKLKKRLRTEKLQD